MKKLKSNKGLSLVEMLVALGILVMIVVAIGVGMTSGSRVYQSSAFDTDCSTMSGIVNTALSDILRYAQDVRRPADGGLYVNRTGTSFVDDSGADVRFAAYNNSDFVFTNLDYGVQDAYFKVEQAGDDAGVLKICSLRNAVESALINAGAYSDLEIQNFSISYIPERTETVSTESGKQAKVTTGGYFDITYTVVSKSDSAKTKDVVCCVRLMNPEEIRSSEDGRYTVFFSTGEVGNVSGCPKTMESKVVNGNASQIELPTPRKSGWVFLGWQVPGKTELLMGGTLYTPPGDITLTAQWETDAPTVYITYHYNDATETAAEKVVKAEAKEGKPLQVLSIAPGYREGLAFMGWWTSMGEQIEDGYLPQGDLDVYASWDTASYYTVTFSENYDGGAVTTEQYANDYGAKFTLKSASRENWHFTGWYDANGGFIGTTGDNFTVNGDMQLYAHWSCWVTYVANYSGNNQKIVREYPTDDYPNGRIQLPALFTRENWGFYAWYTHAGSNQSYEWVGAADGSYALTGDATLYAHWICTLSFADENNKSWANVIAVYDPGEEATLPSALHRDGYTFVSWKNGGEVVGTAGDKYYPAGNTNLTPAWQLIPYTITYAYNRGTDETETKGYSIALDLTLLDPPSNPGYEFTGWKVTEVDADEGNWQLNKTYAGDELHIGKDKMFGNVTLTAQWGENSYKVHYDKGTGTGGSMADRTVKYSDSFALAENAFYKNCTVSFKESDGTTQVCPAQTVAAEFRNWSGSDGNTYDNGQTVSRLTAVNGATVTMTANWKDYTLALPTPTKTGYTFAGWCKNQNLSDTPMSSYTGPESITLYAKWNKVDYVITYKHGNGAADTTSGYTIETAGLTLEGAPSRTGYTFMGWGLSTTETTNWDTAKTYRAGENVGTGKYGNVTMTAKWQENTYTIRYAPGTGSGSMADQTGILYSQSIALSDNTFTKSSTVTLKDGSADYDALTVAEVFQNWSGSDGNTYTNKQTVNKLTATDGAVITMTANWQYTKSLPTPTKDGYTFKGWCKNQNLSDSPMSSYTGTGSVTLYAKWEANTYTVTYKDADGSELSSRNYTIEDSFNLANVPSRPGYDYANTWTMTTSAGNWAEKYGTSYSSAQNVTGVWGNVTMKASRTEHTYTIHYDKGSGTSGSMADQTDIRYSQNVTLTSNAFTKSSTVTLKEGNTTYDTLTGTSSFKNWSCNGNTYNNGAQVSQLTSTDCATVTMTANWNNYTVTLPTPAARTGYTFKGWCTDSALTSTPLTGSYSNSTNVTLYAKWEVNTYKLELEMSGAKITINGTQYSSNTALNISYGSSVSFSVSYDYTNDDGKKTSFSSEAQGFTAPTGTSGSFNMPAGTVTITASSSNCVVAGTLITLADGTQIPVEKLTGDELLLVWNLETGAYDAAPMLFIDSDKAQTVEVIHLFFEDGTDVEVVSEHGFFDSDLGKYVYLDNTAAEYIGHRFVKANGEGWKNVKLTKVTLEKKVIATYSPVTFSYMCYYVNGMLSMPGNTEYFVNIYDVDTGLMKYDALKKQADIEKYGLFTAEDFEGLIPEVFFEAFNGKDLKVAMAKGIVTWEQIAALTERYASMVE